jgi:hypothetical protein
MPKKFTTVEERRAYWKQWYENNKHREDYKAYDKATKQRLRKERQDWYIEYKKTFSCEKCGIKDFRVLDLHHLDRSLKREEVSNMPMKGLSKEVILTEIAKCKCLCANCHRIEHWEEKNIIGK